MKIIKTNNKKKIAAIVIGLAFIASILLTTDMSLRTAVFFISPYSAVTMDYKYYKSESDNCDLYVITKNIPHEKETDSDLEIWAVYRLGPLHYSKCFGYA